jgi:hypothetical protein
VAHFAPEWVVQFKAESLAHFHWNTQFPADFSDLRPFGTISRKETSVDLFI